MIERRRARPPVQPAELLQSPLYSRSCQDALKIMERLADWTERRHETPDFSTLSMETGMSVPAVTQLVYFLERAGLLKPRTSMPRAELAQAPEKISMLDVVRAIDGTDLWTRCLLGLQECSDETPCPAHSVWKKARGMLERELGSRSIAELARAIGEKKRRRLSGSRQGPPPRRPRKK